MAEAQFEQQSTQASIPRATRTERVLSVSSKTLVCCDNELDETVSLIEYPRQIPGIFIPQFGEGGATVLLAIKHSVS